MEKSETLQLVTALTAIKQTDWDSARAVLEGLLSSSDPDIRRQAHAWLGLLLIGPKPMSAHVHLQQAAKNSDMAAALVPVFQAEKKSGASDDPAYRLALLGVAFLDLQNLDTQASSTLAARALLDAIHHNPAYADAYAYLSQALDQLGQTEGAHTALEEALRLDSQSPTVHTLAGLYWDRRGDFDLARQHYETAFEQQPENLSLGLEIAATYAAEENYTGAEAWLLHAVQMAPQNPQAWETLAYFYLNNGIGVERSGLPAAAKLVALAPQSAAAHDLMGWAYFLTQQEDKAKASLEKALALDPSLASAHYHLGQLYIWQGQYAKAAYSFQRAADCDPQGQLTQALQRAWETLPETYR